MTKFEYTKESIAEAIEYLKTTNDYFYKDVTAWDVLTKSETTPATNSVILDEANTLFNNLNKWK